MTILLKLYHTMLYKAEITHQQSRLLGVMGWERLWDNIGTTFWVWAGVDTGEERIDFRSRALRVERGDNII